MVGYLDMTDPSQQCPDSWLKIASPRSSCGKRTMQTCDSLSIPTAGASYQKVCGRFRGYQIGTTDAFYDVLHLGVNIETHFADGVIVTYGSPGRRQHVYSYVAALWESVGGTICPCAGGAAPPLFVGSDYYCESGNPVQEYHPTSMYSSDVLWDRQQCGGNETTCCDPPDIPWFCKTFSTQISEDLEVRICTDESSVDNENVAIESFELYIQVAIPFMNIQVVSVLNSDNTPRQLDISWTPVGSNVTTYTVRVLGADSSVGQGCTVCTTSPCLYVHQVTRMANNYYISVTSINRDGTLGSQNNATFGPTNSVIRNISSLSYSNSIGCSFLNNQSFYCVVCCSTDHTVPPNSSVYSISSTRGTEVTISLQGLTSGQVYYCKAAASSNNTASCAGPVVGRVKGYITFVASLSSTTFPTASTIPLIQAVSVLNSDYMYTLRQLEIYWIPLQGSNVTTYTVRVVGADSSVGQGYTVCTTSPCFYIHQVTHMANNYSIYVTSINQDGPQNSITLSPTNSVIQNISFLSYSNSIGCSFLNNQSFYCVVCCSTDPSVPPDSSVYNISSTKGTEVTVSLQGLTSGQVYYCKAAASSNNIASCAGLVVGGVKGYIIFVASFPSITFPTTSNLASIGTHTIIGITIGISFVVFFCLGVLVTTCIGCMVKTRSKVTLHHTAMKPSAYEMIENSQKTMTAPEVEPNSAYGTTKVIEVEPNSAYGTTKAIEVEPNYAFGTTKAIEVEPNSAYGTAKKITATEVKPNSTYRSAKAIEVEPNSAYGTAKKITATVVEPNLHME
ncbi:hypothetical protein EMCRGX_G002436 [Ephydatia muelleri]